MKCWQLSYNCKNSWKILQRCGCKRQQHYRKEQWYRTAEGQSSLQNLCFWAWVKKLAEFLQELHLTLQGWWKGKSVCLQAESALTQTPGGPANTATCQTKNHWRRTRKRKHLCQQVRNAVLHNTSQKAWKEKFYLALVKSIWFLCIFPIKYRQSFLAASADSLNSSGWKNMVWTSTDSLPALSTPAVWVIWHSW